MAVNLVVADVSASSPNKSITYTLYFSSTYTLNGTGDNLDFTATTNPDGSQRNPSFFSGAFPARIPVTWAENGGDMGGAFVEITKGNALTNWKLRFYQANGTELGTSAAYPGAAPTTAAGSNLQLTITGKLNLF